ncbi:MAG: ABC transporter permease [Bacteroidota bacterium]|nr:ABC transporter permease [Bacteroidota bacterium]
MLNEVVKNQESISVNEKSNIISNEPVSKVVRKKVNIKGKLSSVFLGIPLIIVFFILWEVLPRVDILNPIFFPPFSKVIYSLKDIVLSGELPKNIEVSLLRALIGFLLGAVVAIPLGFLMGRYSIFEKLTDLFIQMLRNTSQFALLPVFIMLLGIGEASKIAMTFNAAVWVILINTISGVKGVEPLLIKAAVSMGTSDKDLFKKVIFPASFPSVVAGARLAIKGSLMAVIGAEMLGAKSGLGFFIQNAQLLYRIPEMYAGILVLTAIGLTLNYLLIWVEKKATSWKNQNDNLSF